MLAFVDNVDEAEPPKIRETEEDENLDVKQLKEKYTEYAYRRFVMEPSLILLNQDTGWKIEVTTKVIKEWWKKSRQWEFQLTLSGAPTSMPRLFGYRLHGLSLNPRDLSRPASAGLPESAAGVARSAFFC